MSVALLVEYFEALPEDALQGIEDVPADRQYLHEPSSLPPPPTGGKAKRRAALHLFNQKVRERYLEGTLIRLSFSECALARRAAVFALGQLGTLESNPPLARCLHDTDGEIAELAAAAMRRVWFRGSGSSASDQLYRIVRLSEAQQALLALDQLIEKLPDFAEAYYQRAVFHYRSNQVDLALRDCAQTVKLNPHHFAAQAGLGQCLLRLRRHNAALKAFRLALRIHPRLEEIAATVRELESTQGEDGR